MRKEKTHKKKCPDKLAKRMRECMNVIRPTQNKKARNDHNSGCNYNCGPNVELMAHLSLNSSSSSRQIPQRQEDHSTETHRNSFDSFESYDIADLLAMELFDPSPIPPTYVAPPIQDYMATNDPNNVTPYDINNVTPFDQQQQQTMHIDPNFYGINMSSNQFVLNTSPAIDKALPAIVSPLLQSNLFDMPSRPNPPSFTDGPQYFKASTYFRVSFESVDVDDSHFITFEELTVFLVNSDGSCFTNEAVMMIMGMFDKSK